MNRTVPEKGKSRSLDRGANIYARCLGCITVVVGILYIIATARLYFTGGDNPYSRERVGEFLSVLLLPSAFLIAGIVGGAVLHTVKLMRYGSSERSKNKLSPSRTLKIMTRNFDVEKCSERTRTAVLRIRAIRRGTVWGVIGISVLLTAIAVILAVFVPDHAVEGMNSHVILALCLAIPSTVLIIAVIFIAILALDELAKRELLLIKGEILSNPSAKSPVGVREYRFKPFITLGIFIVGIVFVILGIFNGGMQDVFDKAVAICTECIGLG